MKGNFPGRFTAKRVYCLQHVFCTLASMLTKSYVLHMSLINMIPSIVWGFHEKKDVSYDPRKIIFANFERLRKHHRVNIS